jgi:hypothetical protein
MPEEKKFDPFKPSQPQIPGVSTVVVDDDEDATSSTLVDTPELTTQRTNSRWIIAGVATALVIGAAFGWWTHRSSSGNPRPKVEAAAPAPDAEMNATQPAANLPLGPGVIASTKELLNPWSEKHFLYRNPLTGEIAPAMVVRLPDGKFWGLSLRESYGKCDMELVTDLQKLQSFYNFNASHPMVGDPCDRSVFDLTRYTSAPGGLVRGELVQGPAMRPPVAIEISTRGDKVVAERME